MAFMTNIRADLYTALRANHTNFNLSTVSGTHKVLSGDGGLPGFDPPYVLISGGSAVPSYEGAHLGGYLNTYRWEWFAYAPATGDTADDRIDAAEGLADDVITAIQTAHATNTYTALYICTRVLPTLQDIFGDGIGLPAGAGMAVGFIDVTITREVGI